MIEPYEDALVHFDAWYAEARDCEAIRYAHAFCLATVDEEGRPDARTVLLKRRAGDTLVFFTDERSNKGRQLAAQDEAAIVFYWEALDRQVRLRGRVKDGSDKLSDECFAARPRHSQLTTWASRQSRPSPNRDDLEARYEKARERFADQETIARPDGWRAYRFLPHDIELWQARAGRLHERLHYTRAVDGLWIWQWLDP